MESSVRPWGKYLVLAEDSAYKVKRIEVAPGKRLSYQSHERRAEHWLIISGSGIFTLNDQISTVKAGDACNIKVGDKHRIENTGAEILVFVEIQTGTYFGEDDIHRYDDDFGRS
jgi:mannose-6-phosphate isomerase-like protein (cupin superfamily)